MDITLPDTIFVNIDAIGNLWIYNINCRSVTVLHPWHDACAAECAIKRISDMADRIKAITGGKPVQYIYNRRSVSREALELQFKLRSKGSLQ